MEDDAAKRIGFNVVVIVDQQPATGIRNPLPLALVDAVVSAITVSPRAPGPPTIHALWKEENVRAVAIWNTVTFRLPTAAIGLAGGGIWVVPWVWQNRTLWIAGLPCCSVNWVWNSRGRGYKPLIRLGRAGTSMNTNLSASPSQSQSADI